MDFDAPTAFVVGILVMFVLNCLVPLTIEGRQDYLGLAYVMPVADAILGPESIVLMWAGLLLACPVQVARHLVTNRDPGRAVRAAGAAMGYAALTASAVSAGWLLGNAAYIELLDGTFPMPMETTNDLLRAALAGNAAWVGTMAVRVLSLRMMTGRLMPHALDPFNSILIPYVLPVVGGVPLVVSSIATYDPSDPWLSLILLSWCFPLFGLSWYELHRRSLALDLRRELLARQRLAAIGEVSARIVHQSRHQVGLMGWSIHRLRSLVGATGSEQVQAANDELDALDAAKDHLSAMLASELLHEPSADDDESGTPVRVTTYADAIDDVLRQLREEAARCGLELHAQVEPDLGARWIASSVRDVIFNLVDNAIDAAATEVRVHLGRVGDGWQADTEIRVVDDGPGLGERDHERHFEPFFTTKADGTGMGLAIADALVGELGGSLRYERTGSRTAFVVTLPPPPPGSPEVA